MVSTSGDRSWPRKIGIGLLAAVGSLGLLYGALRLATPYSQWARALVWFDSDIGDIDRFPARVIEDGPGTFTFARRAPSVPPAAIDTVRIAGEDGEAAPIRLREFLRNRRTNAFLVIRSDTIVYEEYFGAFADTALHTSFSVSKSFASALVGAAIDRGMIGSIQDPITDYIPELLESDSTYRRITLHHLVTMSSGIGFDDAMVPWGDPATTYYSPDLRAAALGKKVSGRPGERFHYNNYNPLLIGMVLERVSDTTVSAFLSETIWTRIGMEADGSWSLDSPAGFEKMESGLNARARDFARFGRLFLEQGRWNGRQVLSEKWVKASTRADSSTDPSLSYQYFWWIHPRSEGRDRFYAEGDHGQFVYVAPDRHLIFVRLGHSYSGVDWPGLFRSLSDRMAAGETMQKRR